MESPLEMEIRKFERWQTAITVAKAYLAEWWRKHIVAEYPFEPDSF